MYLFTKIQILKIKYYHQSTPTNIEYRQVYKKKLILFPHVISGAYLLPFRSSFVIFWYLPPVLSSCSKCNF